MHQHEIAPLITEEKIQKKIKEIGATLTKQLKGKDPVVICILKGSIVFYSDLIRHIDTDITCEFLGLSSYANSNKTSGEVKLTMDINSSVKNRHIVIVEDIVDTGLTLNYIHKLMKAREPKSITTVSLLLKPDALKEKCELDHVGFEIPNDFVVGYGLDYAGHYRNLPYIGQIATLI